MLCSNCKAEFPVDAKFCPNCGSPIAGETFEYKEEFVDLAELKLRVLSQSTSNRQLAWQVASTTVFDVIREYTKEGWEAIDQIGADLLILKPARGLFATLMFIGAIAQAIDNPGHGRGVLMDVTGVTLHFRRKTHGIT